MDMHAQNQHTSIRIITPTLAAMPLFLISLFVLVCSLVYFVFASCAFSLSGFARDHPYRFTRGVIGAFSGFLVAWLFDLPYVIEITGSCAISSVVLGEVI